MPKRMQRQCYQCGGQFLSRSTKFCGRQCYYDNRTDNGRIKRQRKCDYCKDVYIPRQKEVDKKGQKYTRFCSRNCASRWQRDSMISEVQTKECMQCGHAYSRSRIIDTAARAQRSLNWEARIFCSVRCSRLSRGMKGKVDAFAYFKDKLKRNTQRLSSGCLVWTGRLTHKGYGLAGSYYSKAITAHRVAYVVHVGPIPFGLFVRHHCDVRECCEPKHLALGTHADNMRDMAERKRCMAGARHRKAISLSQVACIKNALNSGAGTREAAARANVSIDTAIAIAHGRHWSCRTDAT